MVVYVLKGHDFTGCEKTHPVKGTGFSPYVKCTRINMGFSP